jgi:hypothetical protein
MILKTIYHIADVHIRNVKRHKEFSSEELLLNKINSL